jgi:hypothetical protein
MYDRAQFDANGLPREGLAVPSEFTFPNQPHYGQVAGRQAGEFPQVLFRTTAHELGHALGLVHNEEGAAFMRVTDMVARLGTTEVPFPENIVFAYSEDDRIRLQHLPDIMVRPGGPFFNNLGISPPLPPAIHLGSC